MGEEFSLADVEGELVATMGQTDARRIEDSPFCILLLGDWSGRANRSLFASSVELAEWRPLLVDRDNVDSVMQRLGVSLSLSLKSYPTKPLTIDFNELADFHPDRLCERLEIFENLRRTRARLSNPKTFAAAAAEVRGWSGQQTPDESAVVRSRPAHAEPQIHPEKPTAGGLLDQILEGTSTGVSGDEAPQLSPAVSSEIAQLAKAAVDPYLSPDIEADQNQLIAAIDERMAGDLREILHHPDFQSLESAWRAVDFLTTRLDTGTELKLYLLDISHDEFNADLRSQKDLRATALYKLLVEHTVGTPGGIPWAAVAGNYTFDFTNGDSELIERLSLVAQGAGAPFIAAASPKLLGCRSLAETPDPDDWQDPLEPQIAQWWNSLKEIPSATYVGLALPRFLLRLPYGKKTDPIEEFDFEEMANTDARQEERLVRHECYLWGNPAFAVAFLLAKGFAEDGWHFRPSDSLDIEGLPLHIYKSDGDSEIKPCAEVLFTLRAAEKIIDRGLMPLLSMKDTDTVRLGIFQSIVCTKLAGPWSGLRSRS